ncbi:MAG: hypothetical protein A2Y12_17315 [Planctomycetes bacterium GWF2_42_9]|nr:MAG: hypothetical protein A2Y12_17315 [Planctomycetes bacterium GWF2_42_9]
MKRKNILFRKKGFTLVELLVVISIIALLLAVLMPALSKAREQSRQLVCKTRLKQLGVAMVSYVTTYNKYPSYLLHPVASAGGPLAMSDDLWLANYGGFYITWEVMLVRAGFLPKVKQATWANAGSGNDIHASEFWRCPSEPYPSKNGVLWPTTLSHQYGLNSMLSPQDFRMGSFCWPTSKIKQSAEKLLISEVDPARMDKYKKYPLDPSVSSSTIYFRHKNKVNVLFMDGHVGYVDKSNPNVSDSKSELWYILRDR